MTQRLDLPTCGVPGCATRLRNNLTPCDKHFKSVPMVLRKPVWAARWDHGFDSPEYKEAVQAILDRIALDEIPHDAG